MTTPRSLNKVMLIGNLTRPPVLRKTSGGAVVCTFGVATNSSWTDSDGNVQERAEFNNIVAWNKLAEICAQILNTGMLVYVEGELRTRSWEDENGVRHFRTEIKLNDMKLLDSKGKKGIGLEDSYNAGENTGDDYDMPVESSSTETSSEPTVTATADEDVSRDVEDLF